MSEPVSPELSPTSPVPDTNDAGFAKRFFTPKYLILYLILAIVVYGVIYFVFLSDKSVFNLKRIANKNGANQTEVQPQGSVDQFVVSLNDPSSASTSGIAVVGPQGDKLTVQISLVTQSESTPSAAYIQEGSCVNMGPVKYMLNPVISGSSNTLIETSMEKLKKEVPLLIDVRKSQQEPETVIACGEVK